MLAFAYEKNLFNYMLTAKPVPNRRPKTSTLIDNRQSKHETYQQDSKTSTARKVPAGITCWHF